MISNKQIAQELSNRALEIYRSLDEVVLLAQDVCPPKELSALKLAVGRVLGEVLFEIVNPLYREHPELKPDGFD